MTKFFRFAKLLGQEVKTAPRVIATCVTDLVSSKDFRKKNGKDTIHLAFEKCVSRHSEPAAPPPIKKVRKVRRYEMMLRKRKKGK